MDLAKLARFLETASAADRKLDILIGMQIGYERHLAVDADHAQPLQAKWRKPNGDIGKMPGFTESVDAAWEFVTLFCPDASQIGVTFDEHGRGSADVDGQKALQYATPALALCAAALRSKLYDK
ncbi:hypothetical protein [Sinorhizobium americanum]|uniref:Uncharacterized protein n=1 Tax=Sinorhizobium americanum TaxID=194963 RepID=A0A1L3LZ49_9HYPH|nr:hypothetical protein [Sinorhizobium americanum]APG95389.1 hypothetical protein SAMCFNEI73_pC1685 [Sinorhizobium americanum]OAP39524.1 hypothetical protein ATC00_09775 [Sinorhizobium americanum]